MNIPENPTYLDIFRLSVDRDRARRKTLGSSKLIFDFLERAGFEVSWSHKVSWQSINVFDASLEEVESLFKKSGIFSFFEAGRVIVIYAGVPFTFWWYPRKNHILLNPTSPYEIEQKYTDFLSSSPTANLSLKSMERMIERSKFVPLLRGTSLEESLSESFSPEEFWSGLSSVFPDLYSASGYKAPSDATLENELYHLIESKGFGQSYDDTEGVARERDLPGESVYLFDWEVNKFLEDSAKAFKYGLTFISGNWASDFQILYKGVLINCFEWDNSNFVLQFVDDLPMPQLRTIKPPPFLHSHHDYLEFMKNLKDGVKENSPITERRSHAEIERLRSISVSKAKSAGVYKPWMDSASPEQIDRRVRNFAGRKSRPSSSPVSSRSSAPSSSTKTSSKSAAAAKAFAPEKISKSGVPKSFAAAKSSPSPENIEKFANDYEGVLDKGSSEVAIHLSKKGGAAVALALLAGAFWVGVSVLGFSALGAAAVVGGIAVAAAAAHAAKKMRAEYGKEKPSPKDLPSFAETSKALGAGEGSKDWDNEQWGKHLHKAVKDSKDPEGDLEQVEFYAHRKSKKVSESFFDFDPVFGSDGSITVTNPTRGKILLAVAASSRNKGPSLNPLEVMRKIGPEIPDMPVLPKKMPARKRLQLPAVEYNLVSGPVEDLADYVVKLDGTMFAVFGDKVIGLYDHKYHIMLAEMDSFEIVAYFGMPRGSEKFSISNHEIQELYLDFGVKVVVN